MSLVHQFLPFIEASTIGEERETATTQALQFLFIESTAATGGQP